MDNLNSTEQFNSLYWSYNLPLQMWTTDDGTWRMLNYMPRKESCLTLEDVIKKEELPKLCKNTANILRNLAYLFEALGRGEIDRIYYPDQSLEEAIKEFQDEEVGK